MVLIVHQVSFYTKKGNGCTETFDANVTDIDQPNRRVRLVYMDTFLFFIRFVFLKCFHKKNTVNKSWHWLAERPSQLVLRPSGRVITLLR